MNHKNDKDLAEIASIEKPLARRHRRHRGQSRRAARRQWRIANIYGIPVIGLGRYVKRHAVNCGCSLTLRTNPRRTKLALKERLSMRELCQPPISEWLDAV